MLCAVRVYLQPRNRTRSTVAQNESHSASLASLVAAIDDQRDVLSAAADDKFTFFHYHVLVVRASSSDLARDMEVGSEIISRVKCRPPGEEANENLWAVASVLLV